MKYIIFLLTLSLKAQGIRSELISAQLTTPASGITVITSTHAEGVTGGTSAAVNTTGASLFVASMGWNDFGGTAVISDSKANTWTCLTKQQDPSFATGTASKICYVYAPTTDAAQTFTVGGTVGRPGIVVLILQGTTGSFDAQNGTASGGATSIQPGNITPAMNGEIVISGLCNLSSTAITVDSGFTLLFIQGDGGGGQDTVGLGYKIQSTAAAINPTWSWASSVAVAVTAGAFQ